MIYKKVKTKQYIILQYITDSMDYDSMYVLILEMLKVGEQV